jgi:hypothetical protein
MRSPREGDLVNVRLIRDLMERAEQPASLEALRYDYKRSPGARVPFSYEQVAPNEIRVYMGTLRLHGQGNYSTTDPYTDVGLAGSTEWIYLRHVWATTVTTIEHSTNEPVTTSTQLHIPIVKMVAVAGVWDYVLECHPGGDMNFAIPLRSQNP